MFLHKLSHPIATSALPGHAALTEHMLGTDAPGSPSSDAELDMLSREIAAGALREAALTQLLEAGVVPDLCALLGAESLLAQKDAAGADGGDAAAAVAEGEVAAGVAGGSAGSSQGQTVRVDVVGSLLLDMASLPQAPQLFAQQGLVSHAVPLLHRRHSPAARMWALLALCRLAGRSPACQMDIVRVSER